MRFFRSRGFQFIAASEIPEARSPSVCLTFDDAYASALDNGREILSKWSARATFYAVPAFVGETSAWDGERRDKLADWESLLQASREGFEVGNHTNRHTRLAGAPIATVAAEWSDADKVLRARGFNPKSACFPYGDVEGSSAETLQALGYRVGLGIGKWPGHHPPYAYARIVMSYSDGLPKLLYKLWLRPRLRLKA